MTKILQNSKVKSAFFYLYHTYEPNYYTPFENFQWVQGKKQI